ncbi:LytR/AlgR family response regulator transcription factor [Flavilitoribacter nigricans]|uniref:LytR/AlgR family response regulator transcription factor n=1 Tax=Flavilitoribacter nigricans TaxID=70997 RepID=UPI001474DFC2|nr:LytTR family DNA-binding domain-containing protein [Flavilitoribacter nigricans]
MAQLSNKKHLMINAIIIDDEPQCIRTLANDLDSYCPQVRLLEQCTSAKEGLLAIRQHQPDLVFLDINMPWMSGLELLEVVGEISFDVIFTTAHDQYAVQAFRLSAIDYLLKPIDYQELITAVRKVEAKHSRMITREQLTHLQENMNPASSLQRIGIPTKSGIDFVLIQEILYCEADSNYSYVHLTNNRKLYSAKTLKDFDQLLGQTEFCRIHQSFLINLNHLKKYYRGDGGYVEMVNGASLNVSRSKKDELLSRIRV